MLGYDTINLNYRPKLKLSFVSNPTYSFVTIPNAQCPMPNAQRPIPNSRSNIEQFVLLHQVYPCVVRRF